MKSVRRLCWKGDWVFLIAPFVHVQVSWMRIILGDVIGFLVSLARRCPGWAPQPGDLRWLSSFGVTAQSLLTTKATHVNWVLLSSHTALIFSVDWGGNSCPVFHLHLTAQTLCWWALCSPAWLTQLPLIQVGSPNILLSALAKKKYTLN